MTDRQRWRPRALAISAIGHVLTLGVVVLLSGTSPSAPARSLGPPDAVRPVYIPTFVPRFPGSKPRNDTRAAVAPAPASQHSPEAMPPGPIRDEAVRSNPLPVPGPARPEPPQRADSPQLRYAPRTETVGFDLAKPSPVSAPRAAVGGTFDLQHRSQRASGVSVGVVARGEAGFGQEPDGEGAPRSGSGSITIREGGFGGPAVTPRRDSPLERPRPPAIPVEPPRLVPPIPTPRYTENARAQRIEGEVVLEVVFAASGRVVVKATIQPLGYGLDDAARAAAEAITFKPARRGGDPVDFPGQLNVRFRLIGDQD